MKYASIIVGLFILIVAGCVAGCVDKQTPASVTQEEHDRLKQEVTSLNEELRDLRDPRFLLHLVDRELDAVENGRNARGSFSDYFVPNAAKALEAGATKRDIEIRIDRVIALAEKDIYLSSLVAKLMDEGGPEAVHSYAFGRMQ